MFQQGCEKPRMGSLGVTKSVEPHNRCAVFQPECLVRRASKAKGGYWIFLQSVE